MTLEERVRHFIGASGPQHESEQAYEAWIDDKLERMTAKDLLMWLSIATADITLDADFDSWSSSNRLTITLGLGDDTLSADTTIEPSGYKKENSYGYD